MLRSFANSVLDLFSSAHDTHHLINSRNKGSAARKFQANRRLINSGQPPKQHPKLLNRKHLQKASSAGSTVTPKNSTFSISTRLSSFQNACALLFATSTTAAGSVIKKNDSLFSFFTTNNGKNGYAIEVDAGWPKEISWINKILANNSCNATLSQAGQIGKTLKTLCREYEAVGDTLHRYDAFTLFTVNDTIKMIDKELECLINIINKCDFKMSPTHLYAMLGGILAMALFVACKKAGLYDGAIAYLQEWCFAHRASQVINEINLRDADNEIRIPFSVPMNARSAQGVLPLILEYAGEITPSLIAIGNEEVEEVELYEIKVASQDDGSVDAPLLARERTVLSRR